MTDDELRQACEKFLAGIAMDALNTVRYRARVDRVVRFARQQQAVAWREAAWLAQTTGALTDDPINHGHRIAYECEAKSKELEV